MRGIYRRRHARPMRAHDYFETIVGAARGLPRPVGPMRRMPRRARIARRPAGRQDGMVNTVAAGFLANTFTSRRLALAFRRGMGHSRSGRAGRGFCASGWHGAAALRMSGKAEGGLPHCPVLRRARPADCVRVGRALATPGAGGIAPAYLSFVSDCTSRHVTGEALQAFRIRTTRLRTDTPSGQRDAALPPVKITPIETHRFTSVMPTS